jgi:hypothetical protein
MDSDADGFSAQLALSEVEEQLFRRKEEGITLEITNNQPTLAPLCHPVLSPKFAVPPSELANPSPSDLISPPCSLPYTSPIPPPVGRTWEDEKRRVAALLEFVQARPGAWVVLVRMYLQEIVKPVRW